MKTKAIILGVILLCSTQIFPQLKYEGTINYRYKVLQLDDGAFKYVRYNKDEKKVLVYNLDNSLYRTIELPLPKFHFLDEIKHISVRTFNDDDKLELVYSCVEYNSPENYDNIEDQFEYFNFTLNIISETGEMILKVPDSNEMDIIESDGQKKLLIYKHVGEHFNWEDETIIYSLLIKK